jgi:ketosteroid isomerase-like protein
MDKIPTPFPPVSKSCIRTTSPLPLPVTSTPSPRYGNDDAVLLQPGTPPIVGKAAFHDFMKQALAKSPSVKVVKYVPDIHDTQVAGNVAYEWGYFDAAQKSSEQQAPIILRAKLLRVMRWQPDGSWKFTRVMWLPD